MAMPNYGSVNGGGKAAFDANFTVKTITGDGWCLYSAFKEGAKLTDTVQAIAGNVSTSLITALENNSEKGKEFQLKFNSMGTDDIKDASGEKTGEGVFLEDEAVGNDEYIEYKGQHRKVVKTAREYAVALGKTANGKSGPLLWPDAIVIGPALQDLSPYVLYNITTGALLDDRSAGSRTIYIGFNGENHYDLLVPNNSDLVDEAALAAALLLQATSYAAYSTIMGIEERSDSKEASATPENRPALETAILQSNNALAIATKT